MIVAARPDLLCLSHLRWDFVFQRPQHLMTRWAAGRRVFFVEEPRIDDPMPWLDISQRSPALTVVVPHVPRDLDRDTWLATERALLDELMRRESIEDFTLWYYTPMAIAFTRHLAARSVVYDCMDELSAFKSAPRTIREREQELLVRADVVFTGGYSLYEAKRGLHPAVYPVPSSVDVAHFSTARLPQPEPPDQASIPRPRIGYFGVIDERMDFDLIAGCAHARPGWHFVLVGPAAKVDPDRLPRARNIHYLGQKAYEQLPGYLHGWDVALVPFRLNDATRFLSPTKVPEYLAAGCRVVSTPIRDVVRPYGELQLVTVAGTQEEFLAGIAGVLGQPRDGWLSRVDDLLAGMSWDRTWLRMKQIVQAIETAAEPGDADRAAAPVEEAG